MGSIKKLAGQTFWYGTSSIFGRFLNYLLTPLLATLFASEAYGRITTLFAIAAFLNIIFTYGLETSYFRFSGQGVKEGHEEQKVYGTSLFSIIVSTILLGAILLWQAPEIAGWLEFTDNPEYVSWMVIIVMLDALCVMPFARLRYKGRPIRYAAIKIGNILINIGLILFFLVYCRGEFEKDANNVFAAIYDPTIGIGYVIIANLIASALTLLLLSGEIIGVKIRADRSFWLQMMQYSWPLIIVGFGGMVNEVIDRFMLVKLYPGTTAEAYSQTGIYGANYKLAVLIVLFIQAFRLGAEPFFFKQSADPSAPKTYARIMKFFVITCCFCFLAVVLFLDIWKYFMGSRHPEYYTGLKVVPILMVAKIFLGIYYNLSIWYKLTNRNLTGAWITLAGTFITVVFNWLFIPVWGYMACAIATLCCYGFMMVISYRLGQRYYPIPYAWKKLLAYIGICIIIYGIHAGFRQLVSNIWYSHAAGVLLLFAFILLILKIESRELRNLPVLKRLYGTKY